MDRRTREYKDLVKMTPTTEELLGEEIDGELFLYKRSSQCKICTTSDELKNIIDTLLLFPKSYKEVLNAIQPLQDRLGIDGKDRINYENIRNHQKNHLPFEKRAVRDVVERRAREKNISILDANERLLTAEALYEVIVAKGFQELVSGDSVPTINQTIHAMEILRSIEKDDDKDYRPEELIRQLDVILTAIRDVLPNDMKEALFRRIEEYQQTDVIGAKKPAKLKPADIVIEDDYIDDDLEEEQ
jgi:hypothetical protein